jgi:hypothetical protein
MVQRTTQHHVPARTCNAKQAAGHQLPAVLIRPRNALHHPLAQPLPHTPPWRRGAIGTTCVTLARRSCITSWRVAVHCANRLGLV